MSDEHGKTGITNNIVPHETTRDVRDVFLSRVTATLSAVRPPAHTLIYDVGNVENSAWSRSGAGRLVMMADQNFANHRMGLTGNQLFANRVFDWLALGVTWLDPSPASGVVAAGEAQEVDVLVDAEGLGGPFEASLVVRSNDPDQPALAVPFRLDATAAPDIFLSTSTVQFPNTAVDSTSRREVTVGNVGAADLTVTGVTATGEAFEAAPVEFIVSPGEIASIGITFTPKSAGEHAAVIELSSDDPDEETATIDVEGIGGTDPDSATVAAASLAPAAPENTPPSRTALHPNVPNPFNPVTTIRYDVAGTVAVRLVVYDVRGRAVRTLVDAVKTPGEYTLTWSGETDAGGRVSTGVYFCRLVAGRVTQTRKMVLLK
jgi:hypothetical protein